MLYLFPIYWSTQATSSSLSNETTAYRLCLTSEELLLSDPDSSLLLLDPLLLSSLLSLSLLLLSELLPLPLSLLLLFRDRLSAFFVLLGFTSSLFWFFS